MPQSNPRSSEANDRARLDELASAKGFVSKASWRFAITMQYVPHSYTVRGQTRDEEFDAFVHFIRRNGQIANYGTFRTTYLKLGEYKYWTMGAPVEQTTIINRCHEEDEFGEIRDISGAQIEARRQRWEALDQHEKARWWREALERG